MQEVCAMKATIEPIRNLNCTGYIVRFSPWVVTLPFPSVTEAQLHCIKNFVPFEPWV